MPVGPPGPSSARDIARKGDLKMARDFYEGALKAFRAGGDRWGSARSLADLGYVYCEQRDYEEAHATYREALELFSELDTSGDWRVPWKALRVWPCPRSRRTRTETAAAAAHLRQLISAPLPQAEQSNSIKICQPHGVTREVGGRVAWQKALREIASAIQYSLKES